ncbi:hypothetical protein Gpo141_00014720, partial [Globisporangium polare]
AREQREGSTRAAKKRRVEVSTPEESEDDESEDEEEVMRIRNRRGEGDEREYLIAWNDGSLVWKRIDELKLCPILVALYDRYVERYPDRTVSYAEFTARDVPAIGMMSDSKYDDCAIHAVEMVFELMGLLKEARCLRKLGSDYIEWLDKRNSDGPGVDSSRSRGLKLKDLCRYLALEVPKTGWAVDVGIFSRKNYFQGKGRGPGAIVDLALKGKLDPGVHLVHAYKPSGRGHCVAMRYVRDELVIRDESKTTGIMKHRWISNIRFVREIRVRRVHE